VLANAYVLYYVSLVKSSV